MFANERQDEIFKMVKEKGSVTVNELIELFKVSIETVRRDLMILEKQKRLQRVHGGAVSVSQMKKFHKLSQRIKENNQGKMELSRLAVSFIKEEDIISIDSGSTAIEFVEFLKEKFHRLTIVTHSLDVFVRLCSVEGFNVILCGGQFLKEENAFYGTLTFDAISNLHVSKAFIFPSAISLKSGVADYNLELVQIQKAYLHIADEAIIMADSSKYEKNALIKLCDVDQRYTFITDSGLCDETYYLYKENQIHIFRESRKENEQ